HAHGTARAGVTVDRRTLAVLPAQQPQMIPRAGTHQHALVSRLRETKETRHVARIHFQPSEPRRQLGQRSSTFQTIQVANEGVQIVGHDVPRGEGISNSNGSPATDAMRHRSIILSGKLPEGTIGVHGPRSSSVKKDSLFLHVALLLL